MSALSYRSHFLYLAAGVPVIYALFSLPMPAWLNRLTVFFVVVGALHGTALVLALNTPGAWPRRLLFIALAAALSFIAPFSGLLLASALHVPQSFSLMAAYALASAVGASTYWLVIRRMWIPRLTLASGGWVVTVCAVASVASFIASATLTGFGARRSDVADVLPTVVWWFTFSLSIFASERSLDRQ